MKKILIVTKNWIGDILFEIPAIEAVRKQYPEAEIVCMTAPRCREVLEAHPAVSRILFYDEKTSHRSILKRLQFLKLLKRERFDRAYLFHRSRSRAFLLMMAGVPERIGFAVKRPHFLTRAVSPSETPLHHAEYFLDLLAKTGIDCPLKSPYSFYYKPEDSGSVEERLKREGLTRFACFHLGANWEPKRWPAEHFAKLADLLYEKYKVPVIVTGGPGDLALAAEVSKKVRVGKIISWVGETTLGQLGALYSRAIFVVSGDSGPMHIASGAGTPVAALFGPTDPAQTGPRGKGETVILTYVPAGYEAPWYGKDLPEGGWLSNIRPEEVLLEIERKGWLMYPKLADPSSAGTAKPSVKNRDVLFITLSNIGDVILTTPVLMAISKNFSEARITAVVGPRAKGLLEGSRIIDRLVIYDKHAALKEKIHFIQELRQRKYDVVVDLRHTAIPYLVSAGKRSSLFRRHPNIPVREKHLRVLENMGFDISDIPAFDFFGSGEEKRVLEKLAQKRIQKDRGWIVVSPVAASSLKTWRMEGFREVIENLLQEYPQDIFVVGGESERQAAEKLAASFSGRVYSFAGETTLRELAVLIHRASLLLANDSSTAQLGFELQTPAAVIFGPTDSFLFGRSRGNVRIVREPVICSPCGLAACKFNYQACLKDLSPKKVFEACRELLSQTQETLTRI